MEKTFSIGKTNYQAGMYDKNGYIRQTCLTIFKHNTTRL